MHNKGMVYKTLIFAFAAFIFAGCENFIAGNVLKEEIEAKIEYEKTPFVNVFIQKSDVDDNGTLYPSADGVKAKVGESFKISYTASSTYYFLYWQALDSKKNILDSSVVKFDDSAKAATSAVVYIDSEVIIQAVTSPVPKAVVNFKKNFDAAGSVISEDKNTFMMDEEFDFSFVPADGYQFIKWQASNSSIEIKNPESISSKAVAKADGAVTITAICAERPHVGMGNTNPTQTDSVCKDTNIIIDFDKPLGNTEKELSDIKLYLNNVELYYGEEEAFGEPYYKKSDDAADTSRVIIPAHSKYAVDVPVGKTSSIRVVLPDSLFTLDEEENCIYLCPEGKTYSWTYKINENTNDKAKISVKYEPTAGIVTGNNGEFNIGKTVEYLFKPFESTKFISWKWVCVPDEAAVINTSTDNNGEKISFYINEACDINVEAVTAEKLTVASFAPVSKVEGVAKNSDIVITFNKAVANTDAKDLEKVKILLDGVDVKDCYHLPPLVSEDRETITFKADNKKLLPVEKGTKIVTVIVPSDFYYDISEAVKVNLEEYTTSFVVNASTLEKANVNINTTKGTISPSGAYSYNLGDSFDVLYKTESGYKFTGWIIEKGNAKADLIENSQANKFFVRFYDDESKISYKDCFEVSFSEAINQYQATFKVLEEISGCSIKPVFSLIPAVTSIVPAFSNSGTAFDENIEIEFNKSMSPECFKGFYSEDIDSSHNYAVSITDKNGMDLSELFNLPVGSEDNKKWTIRPDAGKIQTLLATETFADIYVTVKTSARDSSEDAMHIEKEYTKSYRINRNHETIPPKFEVLTFASSKEKLAAGVFLSAKTFDLWSDEENGNYKYGDFSQNHIQNHLSFHIELGEYETDLDKLVLSEKRIKTAGIQEVNEDYGEKIFDLSANGKNAVLDFDYDLKSTNDGVIELTFAVWDKTGNKAEKAVYVIRDTTFKLKTVRLTNESDLETLSLKMDSDNDRFEDVFYGTYKSEVSDITSEIEYWNLDGSINKAAGNIAQDGSKSYFEYQLNNTLIDFNKTIYIRISLYDTLKNSYEIKHFIPSCTGVTIENNNGIYEAIPNFDDYFGFNHPKLSMEYKTNYTTSKAYNLSVNKDYTFIYHNHYYDNNIVVDLYGKKYPFKIEKTVGTDLSKITIPDFKITGVEPGERSSGTMKVYLELENIDPTLQYYYSAKLLDPDKTEPYDSFPSDYNLGETNYDEKTVSFNIEFDSLYYKGKKKILYVRLATGKNGNYKSPEKTNLKSFALQDLTPQEFSSIDKAPPKVTSGDESCNRIFNTLDFFITDDFKLKTDSKNLSVFEYAVTPVSNSVQDINYLEDFTEEEWNNADKKIIKFTPAAVGESSTVSISFADFTPGAKYRLDGLVEDQFGNKKVTKLCLFDNNTDSQFQKPTLEKTDKGLPKFKTDMDDSRESCGAFDVEKNEIVTLFSFYEAYHSSGRTITEALKENGKCIECYYILVVNGYSGGKNFITASDPAYYLFSNNNTARMKSFVDAEDGHIVMCDNKTLLFTAYSKDNLGTNIAIWNRCAGKTGYSQLNGMGAYAPDIENVPDGYYYCTMAVFADGEMRMTEVKQK